MIPFHPTIPRHGQGGRIFHPPIPPIEPPADWVPVFADADQVYADGDAVMVPISYANVALTIKEALREALRLEIENAIRERLLEIQDNGPA